MEAWQLKAVEDLTAGESAELALFMHEKRAEPDSPGRACLLWRGLHARLARRSSALQRSSVRYAFPSVPRLYRREGDAEGASVPAADDVSAVRHLGVDFILAFDGGAVRPELADAASYGVWSFRYADVPESSNVPSGFREILTGNPVVTVQLCATGAQGERILRTGCFKTIGHSYVGHVDRLYLTIASWPAHAAAAIGNSARAVQALPLYDAGAAHAAPSNLDVLKFLVNLTRNRAQWLARSCQREEWNIGVVPFRREALLDGTPMPPIQWMPSRSKNWLADPMAFTADGKVHILCEEWDAASSRGKIVATTFQAGNWGQPQDAIVPGMHASYPYIVEHDGAVFCVPEMHAAGEVAVYRAVRFPTDWVKERVILNGPYADSTVFRHEGRWWLFCTEGDENEHLYAFFADDLLGDWTAHSANPVKVDIRCARPAGPPFVHDGKLFRPTQDCALTYGGRVVITRIDALDPNVFVEEICAFIEPDARGKYPAGLHTVSAAGDLCVVDGKRWVLMTPIEIVARARTLMRRRSARAGKVAAATRPDATCHERLPPASFTV
jgi:hypothetical protein